MLIGTQGFTLGANQYRVIYYVPAKVLYFLSADQTKQVEAIKDFDLLSVVQKEPVQQEVVGLLPRLRAGGARLVAKEDLQRLLNWGAQFFIGIQRA